MTIRATGSAAAARPARAGRVDSRRRFAVVMAGGSGTRFWPWSREDHPKQLLALASERSMIADTVARLDGLVPEGNIVVVVGRKHRRGVVAALPQLDPANILSEPVGRNTAACIGWATLEILRRCPDAVVSVFSADHVIRGARAFRGDLDRAFTLADRRRCLITFGIPPTSPETGYGYIRTGVQVDGTAKKVSAFVEKPDLATAKRYVASGKYFWNSGMFAWRADVVWEELATHEPALAAGLEAMGASRRRGVIPAAAVERAYAGLPAISIDCAVLERSSRVVMLPASFAWSDIGSWDAVSALWPADRTGNASRDRVLALDAAGNVVATRGKPVVLLGVKGLVIVDAGDALLVCSRDRCQDVKRVADLLERSGLGELR